MKNKLGFLLLALACCSGILQAQEEKNELMLGLRYFAVNNRLPYLQVHTQMKQDNKLVAVPGATVQVYLDAIDPQNLLGQGVTNEKGDARFVIPAGKATEWNAAPSHSFIATAAATSQYAAAETQADITKARLTIDTLNEEGARSITALVEAFNGEAWEPVPDVDIKIGVRRLGGLLGAGEDESYTTDSTGMAIAAFTRDSLPGDGAGNIILQAKIDDNDQYGTLTAEKKMPWGKSFVAANHFNERTLYAARLHAPVWLMLVAYSIMLGVWGVLIYLVFQLLKIKQLGKGA